MSNIFEYITNFRTPIIWKKIIIHHSLTKDGNAADSDSIKLWHTGKIGSSDHLKPDYNPYIQNPMLDVGYHAFIELVNGQLEYRIGRPLDMPGAHTKGQNDFSIGICCVGNFDLAEPSAELYDKTVILCRAFMARFGIARHYVLPHWAFADKSCPGYQFNILKLRNLISGNAPALP